MIEFIIFAALAWFAITMMKDLMRISEQKAIENAKKKAQEAMEVTRAEAEAARAEAKARAKAVKAAEAEEMVSCAICGTVTAKHEAIATQGQYFCSEPHFLQRPRSEPVAETPVENTTESVTQTTSENL